MSSEGEIAPALLLPGSAQPNLKEDMNGNHHHIRWHQPFLQGLGPKDAQPVMFRHHWPLSKPKHGQTHSPFSLDHITRSDIIRVIMAHITTSVEYGIHCLLWFVICDDRALSSRDLAELQGVSPTFLAKIFPKLESAGIVAAHEGVRGGYLLARKPEQISFLDIVDAIEGKKPLFECQEVRRRCALHGDCPPRWSASGVCAIHAVMLQAEKAMRDSLAGHSLASIAKSFDKIAPARFLDELDAWVGQRMSDRTGRAVRRPGDGQTGSYP